ncbi:hypothetical protein FOL47_010879 [Perkinsus chesapeaki]|uniref:Uncharacterized protein n=1 Tax=Perkinsus chesapeaki TaxID=330153 RepID=A0A7J6MPM8_PERCH|nr:hypothetical protein FOL47_010879 [Perkinsus chesapeaki]
MYYETPFTTSRRDFPLVELTGHEACVVRGTFSNDDKLATASADSSAKIWDLNVGRLIVTLSGGHIHPLTDCTWHGSGNWVVTSCEGGAVLLWDIRASAEGPIGRAKCEDPAYCVSMGNSPNCCSLASGDSQGVLHLWDIRQFASLSSHYTSSQNKPHIDTVASHGPLSSVGYAQDDSVIFTAGLDGMIRLWSSWSGDCLRTLGAGASGTECMGATMQSRDIRDKSTPVYVAGLYSDGLARVWDLRSHQTMRWLHGFEQPGNNCRGMSESAPSSRAQSVQGSPQSTSTKAPSNKEEGDKIKHFCRPCVTTDSEAPLLFVPGLDRRLYVIDLCSGKQTGRSPVGHLCALSSVSANSNGRVLATTGYGRDASAVIWLVQKTTGEEEETEVEELNKGAFHEVPPQIAGLRAS